MGDLEHGTPGYGVMDQIIAIEKASSRARKVRKDAVAEAHKIRKKA